MATLRDIAKAVGVDISTVSKVLQGAPIRVSESRRQEIFRVAEQLNYRPNMVARGLRLGKSGAIAMPVPSTANYLYPEIIGGAEDAADRLGYVLFVLKQSAVDPLGRILNIVAQGRVDGLIFADDAPSAELVSALNGRRVPFISLNKGSDLDSHCVALDDQAGFALQAEYLERLGHRRVAFVKVIPTSFTSELCMGTFAARLEPEWVWECDFFGEGVLSVIERYGASDAPTAIATASVVVAARLVQGLREKGIRVPEDVSVIGYHDSPIAQWPLPGVTTVKMASREQGMRGVEALCELIAKGTFAGEVVSTPPEIIDRGTCAAVLPC